MRPSAPWITTDRPAHDAVSLGIGCVTPDPNDLFGASRSLLGLVHCFRRIATLRMSIAVMTRGALSQSLGDEECTELLSHEQRRWFRQQGLIKQAFRLTTEVLMLIWRLRRFYKRHDSRVAYVNTIQYGTPIIGGFLAGIPCVVHLREAPEYAINKGWVARGRLLTIRYLKPRCIVVSKSAGETARMLGVPPERIKMLHNAVDTTHFSPRPQQPARHILTVVCITRISPEKGVDDLLLAAPHVLRDFPRVRFVLVGGPTDSNFFKQVIGPLHRKARLEHHWTFAGLLDDPRDELAGADLVVVPSRQESFGRVSLEAMAMGKPVVATDAGGLPEVVQHRVTGLVVPREHPERLAQAIVELLRDSKRREAMGHAGREIAVRDFSLSPHAECVASLLRDAAEGRW